jgi:hypothetical protein
MKDLKRLWKEEQVRMKLKAEGLNDPTKEWRVGASSDDCYHRKVPDYFLLGTMIFSAGDLTSSIYDENSGARFTNINIPREATINSAYLKLCAYQKGVGAPPLPETFIEGEAADNATTFTTSTNYKARPRTSAVVSWTPPSWIPETWYTSPNIKTVIQEIINRAGWVSGNALVLFWRDAPGWGGRENFLDAYSYDKPPLGELGPRLEITWTLPTIHTLKIESEPISIPVKINDQSIGYTPQTVTVEEGEYIISVPAEVTV